MKIPLTLGALFLLALPAPGQAQTFFSFSPRPYGYGFGASGGAYSPYWGGQPWSYPGMNWGNAPIGTYYNTPTHYVTPPLVTYTAPSAISPYALRPANHVIDTYTPAPRMRTSLYPAVPFGTLPSDEGRANLDVQVPTGTTLLWLNNVLTEQTGGQRRFLTPVLNAGSNYSFDVRIQWYDGAGQLQTRKRKIDVRAGEHKVIDLTAS